MRGLAIICFFFSGASGLIFEVIWTRMFSLVFGATTLAISTVLTAFMGGLALGSFRGFAMPPGAPPLTRHQLQQIAGWIDGQT